MNELFGPIIGITLVLMSVFLPAAFIPGLTGRMFAQFALVIAATALLSAINAATLKPTQCALWLRPPVPPERRNLLFRAFNAVYGRFENAYAGLIARMVAHSPLMCLLALIVIGAAGYGLSRIPTGFLPDRGPGLRAGDSAIAGRRLAPAHRARPRSGQRDCAQGSRRRSGDRDLGRLRARQQLDLAALAPVLENDICDAGDGQVELLSSAETPEIAITLSTPDLAGDLVDLIETPAVRSSEAPSGNCTSASR